MSGPASVDEYLTGIPVDARAAFERLREAVNRAAPETTETISYQMPTFKYQGRALIGFAAFKNHCSFFPYSKNVMTVLEDDLEPYDTSGNGATIRFAADTPLPDELVEKLVRARVAEIEARKR